LKSANSRHAVTTGAANSSARRTRGRDAATTSIMIDATITMFGRVRMAAADARPAANAVHAPARMAKTHAASHHAVTGTSLIVSSVWNRNSGLAANSTHAINAVAAPKLCSANVYVSQTASPLSNGTM
jgi:hypothetical protein